MACARKPVGLLLALLAPAKACREIEGLVTKALLKGQHLQGRRGGGREGGKVKVNVWVVKRGRDEPQKMRESIVMRRGSEERQKKARWRKRRRTSTDLSRTTCSAGIQGAVLCMSSKS
jgi:hypothetical protein